MTEKAFCVVAGLERAGKSAILNVAAETAVAEAVQKLQRSFKGLGVTVILEKEALSPSAFRKDPLESNRIWIAGKPIEQWLSATSGQSKCGSSCGASECRTFIIDGETYEAIPAELIVKAGLLAGAELVRSEPQGGCYPTNSPQGSKGCCPISWDDRSERERLGLCGEPGGESGRAATVRPE